MAFRLVLEGLEERSLPTASFRQLPAFPFSDRVVLDHARAVFAHGQGVGRDPNSVLKIGDSNSAPLTTPAYLAPLGSPVYDPGSSGLAAVYPELLDTWFAFRSGPGSLAREGPAA